MRVGDGRIVSGCRRHGDAVARGTLARRTFDNLGHVSAQFALPVLRRCACGRRSCDTATVRAQAAADPSSPGRVSLATKCADEHHVAQRGRVHALWASHGGKLGSHAAATAECGEVRRLHLWRGAGTAHRDTDSSPKVEVGHELRSRLVLAPVAHLERHLCFRLTEVRAHVHEVRYLAPMLALFVL